MLIVLAEFVFQLFEYLIFILFFSIYMEKKPRYGIKSSMLLILLFSCLDFAGNRLQLHILAVLINTILILVLGYILYEGSLRRRVLFTSIFLFFSFLLEMASGFSLAAVLGIEAVYLIAYPEVSLLATALYLAVKLVLVVLLAYIPGQKSDGEERVSFQLKMTLIPLFSFIGMLVMGYQFLVVGEPDYIGCVSLGIFLFLLNILYFMVLASYARLSRVNYKNQIAAREYEMKEEYYQALELHQKEIRTIKHDLKNQLLSISGYLEESESSKAGEQLHLIMGELQGGEQLYLTGHKGLNMLLSAKYRKAVKEEIVCEFKIKVPDELAMDEKELGSLIGNILDNAIEGCMKCGAKRYIRMKMVYHKNALIIQSENSTDGRVKDFSTRKTDKRNHGIGMKSMERIIKKYNGNMDYTTGSAFFRLELTLWF